MIYGYAIDPDSVPELASTHLTLRYIKEKFGGIGSSRIMVEYPKYNNWKSKVLKYTSQAPISPVHKTRIEALVSHLSTRARIKRMIPNYEGNISWIDNADKEIEKLRCEAIISSNNENKRDYIINPLDEYYQSSNRWDKEEKGYVVPRTVNSLKSLLGPLLLNSSELMLIDPYFNPTQPRHKDFISIIIDTMKQRMNDLPSVIQIHCKYGDRHPQLLEFKRNIKEMFAKVPKEIVAIVNCFRWEERDNGERFHNRYLMSDIGGVMFGTGLETDTSGSTDDINLMGREQYFERKRLFDPSTTKYDLEPGCPFKIVKT